MAKKPNPKKPSPKKRSQKKVARVSLPRGEQAHGVALVETVIARVQAGGFGVLGSCGPRPPKKPVPVPPEALRALRFPNGAELSPALQRWLAFDAAWLGWFEDPRRPVFRPLKLDEYVRAEFSMEPFGYDLMAKRMLTGDCFGLHFGSDSRRFLYVGVPDARGEHPVLLLDTDDLPYVGVEYPGIDVYLGVFAGLVRDRGDSYGTLRSSPRYAEPMAEHAAKNLWGAEVGVRRAGDEKTRAALTIGFTQRRRAPLESHIGRRSLQQRGVGTTIGPVGYNLAVFAWRKDLDSAPRRKKAGVTFDAVYESICQSGTHPALRSADFAPFERSLAEKLGSGEDAPYTIEHLDRALVLRIAYSDAPHLVPRIGTLARSAG